ncbi:MAG: hypothetical protein M1814_002212 [Vezdaea aestivalis]|nr:MAG: hypothetical protein M1814_002212 [Vezdaea aestivalis]
MASETSLLAYARSISKRIIVSYVIDFLTIVIFVAGGTAFSLVGPTRPPFSLFDASIGYPYQPDTISNTTAVLVAVAAPLVIITVVCLVTTPGPTITKAKSDPSRAWDHKLWELFIGWLGLVLAFALSFFISQATKNLFGKHRPDFLARCDPDFEGFKQYAAGRLGNFDFDHVLLFTWQICRTKNGAGLGNEAFDDGFRAFPSGHTTSKSWPVSFAGLIYLALFLSAKFAVVLPYVSPYIPSTPTSNPQRIYTHAAAPPLYLLVLVFIPVGGAICIGGTRYSDHKHDGFTVLFSAAIGTVIGWFAFRWYHAPVRRGAGWAWGPRTQNRAFGVGVGVGTYVGEEGWRRKDVSETREDLESGGQTLERSVEQRAGEEDFELSDFPQAPASVTDSSQRRVER